MTRGFWLTLWGGLYIVCAGLGFIPEPQGAGRVALTAVSLLFFLPPAVLAWRGVKSGDPADLLLIRNLSALSLVLTAVLLVLNFLAVLASEWAGTVLYYMLVVVSSPMICSGYWAVSLFFWACLLMVGLKHGKKP